MISTHLVARDLTAENAELREELQHTRAELRELEKTNHRFAAFASHELRTPLAILFGYAKLLEQGTPGDGNAYAGIICAQAWQLMNTVDLMLLMHQIDAGELTLRTDRLLLSQVIEQVVDRRQRDIVEKELSVHAQLEEALVVEADREKLAVIVGQLLSNAIKRSPHGASITIEAHVDPSGAIVSLRDSGEAMPQSKQLRAYDWVFDGIPLAGERTGSELGLAVARALVELHGGKIWIESRDNRGCTISFSIPEVSNQPRVPGQS